jgi:uncharacterized integral membrane protein (TIGR00698 family)
MSDMTRIHELLERVPGLALATGIAIVATTIGHFVPIVGGPVSGIIIGVVLATAIKPGARLRVGMRTASRTVLQLSVVVLGSQLSLAQIAKVGIESLPVMIGTLVVCLAAAWLIGRWLGITGNLRTLIGVGTGVCGASAIAAVTPVIGAVGIDVAYAISTIFLFNIAAVLVFPVIGHLLGLSQHAFGLFAGTAVNDMSSVVATATTYGPAAANYAVVVKLVRTLMIIPLSFGLAAWAGKRDAMAARVAAGQVATSAAATESVATSGVTTASAATDGTSNPAQLATNAPRTAVLDPAQTPPQAPAPRAQVHVLRLVPWFLIGFILVAAANSIGLIPAGAHSGLSTTSVFLITIALSAIGLSTDLAGFRRAGHKPLILGASLWVIVSLTSLGLQFATGLH